MSKEIKVSEVKVISCLLLIMLNYFAVDIIAVVGTIETFIYLEGMPEVTAPQIDDSSNIIISDKLSKEGNIFPLVVFETTSRSTTSFIGIDIVITPATSFINLGEDTFHL